MRLAHSLVILLAMAAVSADAHGREWKDVTGLYSLDADLVGFDDEHVILQRTDNKELGAFPRNKLSQRDHEYLKSKEAQQLSNDNLNATQLWTMSDGLKVPGRIVDFAKADIVLQARRGRSYANNQLVNNLPEIYQKMLPKIIQHFEPASKAEEIGTDRWLRLQAGQPRTFSLEGVMIELENGDEYGVPFFLLSQKDQAVLRPGWQQWLKDREDYDKHDDHAFRLQNQAAAYQRNQQYDRQIALMNLEMQAIQAGITSAWEVSLYPVQGNPNPPIWVVETGRSSLEATQKALRRYPGYRDGPVRKLSNRR